MSRENINLGRGGVAKRCEFTFVVPLAAIAIIGILIALLLPTVQAALRMACSNHIKQMWNFISAKNSFPPTRTHYPDRLSLFGLLYPNLLNNGRFTILPLVMVPGRPGRLK